MLATSIFDLCPQRFLPHERRVLSKIGLLFSKCFQKAISAGVIKTRDCMVKTRQCRQGEKKKPTKVMEKEENTGNSLSKSSICRYQI